MNEWLASSDRARIMGIVNVTPDSFSDGGKFLKVEAARLQAQHIVEAGADWLDLGGESTGPGSVEVSLEEELQRVLPALECILEDHPEQAHFQSLPVKLRPVSP